MLSDKLREDAIELPSFLDAVFLSPPTRVPGTAVFLSAELGITPNALMHNLKHNKGAARAERLRHRAPPRGALDRL